MANQPCFDVFLAHNSQDKPLIRIIAKELARRGLKPWIDEEQIPPGRPFQDVIQQAIQNVKSAAIFIGTKGIGKWELMELRTLISQCVEKDIPVIPVLLPGIDNLPHHLLFLKELNWVRFASRIDDIEALNSLEWGIIIKGKLEFKPLIPNYRTKDGLHLIAYPKQAFSKKLLNNQIIVPLGNRVQTWFGVKNFALEMPSNLEYKDIREIRILPRNRGFYVEFVYKVESTIVEVNPDLVLGIDHGIDNWLTCVSNAGTSFIVDGLKLKSLNQWYNKRVATLMKGLANGFWSNQLSQLTERRNRQMRDAVNKAARLVINHCIENKIGRVVFGWNRLTKKNSNMGRLNNQKFVQIPTARLKSRLSQLCEQYGIEFIETEESYTSKASFVDNDTLPVFGEKPEGWQPSGRRVKRGLYRTSASNWYINADCNGAANIIRKVATMLGIDLSGVGRGVLTAPLRIALW